MENLSVLNGYKSTSDNGVDCGYLIAGRAKDLDATASLGTHEFFIIEADEYDTAFFDKRSKFIHYHPKTLLINNLEFDHADIFSSLSDIKAISSSIEIDVFYININFS